MGLVKYSSVRYENLNIWRQQGSNTWYYVLCSYQLSYRVFNIQHKLCVSFAVQSPVDIYPGFAQRASPLYPSIASWMSCVLKLRRSRLTDLRMVLLKRLASEEASSGISRRALISSGVFHKSLELSLCAEVPT